MQKEIFWILFTLFGLRADFLLPFWWACAATIPIVFAAWWIADRSDWFRRHCGDSPIESAHLRAEINPEASQPMTTLVVHQSPSGRRSRRRDCYGINSTHRGTATCHQPFSQAYAASAGLHCYSGYPLALHPQAQRWQSFRPELFRALLFYGCFLESACAVSDPAGGGQRTRPTGAHRRSC